MGHMSNGSAALRRGVYLLFIAAATGSLIGRVLAVNSVDMIRLEQHLKQRLENALAEARQRGDPQAAQRYEEELLRGTWRKQRPFLSANDRSRWCTVRALVEHGTYAIDQIVAQPNWDTIDMVKHDGFGRPAPEPDEGHLYSSKPPLYATLLAGPYWLIHRLTGWTLGTHPYAIGRLLIVIFNVLPLVLYWLVLARLLERYGTTDWGRCFVMAAATFGTFLTTFGVVINNHLPSAVCALVSLYAGMRIWCDGERRLRYFALCGLFGTLAAAFELPAAAFACTLAAMLLYKAPRHTLLASAPAALLVAAAFFATNYAAHRSWRPPYMHRSPQDNWYDYQYRLAGDSRIRQSYWSDRQSRSPIDQGEPSPARYALHVLVGHHGIFSLTPLWLLTVPGLVQWCQKRQPERAVGWMIVLVSLVVIAFYLARPVEDRNYGGMTSGFRWVFWMAPLWLVGLIPVADRAGSRRWLQIVCGLCLCLAALSAAYPTWNPWTHPWLLNFLLEEDLVRLGMGSQ